MLSLCPIICREQLSWNDLILVEGTQVKLSVGTPEVTWHLSWLVSHFNRDRHVDLDDAIFIELATDRIFDLVESSIILCVIEDEHERLDVVLRVVIRSTPVLMRQLFHSSKVVDLLQWIGVIDTQEVNERDWLLGQLMCLKSV